MGRGREREGEEGKKARIKANRQRAHIRCVAVRLNEIVDGHVNVSLMEYVKVKIKNICFIVLSLQWEF